MSLKGKAIESPGLLIVGSSRVMSISFWYHEHYCFPLCAALKRLHFIRLMHPLSFSLNMISTLLGISEMAYPNEGELYETYSNGRKHIH